MSKMRIGKSAAILYAINEGLRKEGFVDEEMYEVFKQRYSQPLLEIVKGGRRKKAGAGKLGLRCQWAAGSSDKCRRVAQVMMKREDTIIQSCPEHISRFRNHGFQVLEETYT